MLSHTSFHSLPPLTYSQTLDCLLLILSISGFVLPVVSCSVLLFLFSGSWQLSSTHKNRLLYRIVQYTKIAANSLICRCCRRTRMKSNWLKPSNTTSLFSASRSSVASCRCIQWPSLHTGGQLSTHREWNKAWHLTHSWQVVGSTPHWDTAVHSHMPPSPAL